MSEEYARRWKREVIVENRPGLAGTASVAKAPADGHTLLLASNGQAMIQSLNRNLNFDPIEDFSAITKVAALPGIFVGPPEGPRSLLELIERARAEPGKLNYASAGLGSASSIGIELLKSVAMIDLTHVPHKGIPDSHVSVMRGDAALFMTFYSAAGDLIASGKLRALAVAGNRRLAALPDLPTVQEAGLPGYSYEAWFGLLAPKGTPKTVVDNVNATTAEILKLDAINVRFTKLGVDLGSSTPAAFAALLKSDSERFLKIFGKAGEPK